MDGRVKTAPHDALLGCMLQASQAQIIPPGAVIEGVPQAFNPTDYALIIAPLMVDKQVVGLLEILMDPTRRAAQQKSTLRFVSDLCDLAGNLSQEPPDAADDVAAAALEPARGFHPPDPRLARPQGDRLRRRQRRQAAGRLRPAERGAEDRRPDDGRGGQRPGGRRAAVQPGARADPALQGRDPLGRRPGLHRQYRRASRRTFATRSRCTSTSRVPRSWSSRCCTSPRNEEGPDQKEHKEKVPFGCLVAEQIGDELAPTDMHARTEVVSRHASTALWNSQEHHKIFLKPVLKAMGSPWRMFRGRTLAKIGAVAGGDPGPDRAPWRSFPARLTIEGHGSLLPEERRKIYAPVAGIVVEVPVDHGDIGQEGRRVAKLDSKELQKELKRLIGRAEKAREPETDFSRTRIRNPRARQADQDMQSRSRRSWPRRRSRPRAPRSRSRSSRSRSRSMNITVAAGWDHHDLGSEEEPDGPAGRDRHRALEHCGHRRRSTGSSRSRSPTTTWGRSYGPEQARAGDRRRHEATRRRPARVLPVATNPEHKYQGYVRRIAAKAETVEQKHVVKVTVGFDEAVRHDFLSRNQELRPGAEVRARVDCGKTHLAYYLLRKASRSSTSRCCSAGRSCTEARGRRPGAKQETRGGRSPLPTNEIAGGQT